MGGTTAEAERWGTATQLGAGRNGAQGIIVITYTPASATTIIVDAPVIFEFLTSQTPGTVTPIEFRATQHNDLSDAVRI